jgi:hypothetical protein
VQLARARAAALAAALVHAGVEPSMLRPSGGGVTGERAARLQVQVRNGPGRGCEGVP